MDAPAIVAIVVAFLVVDAFVMWKVFGAMRSRAGSSGLGVARPAASDYAVSGLSDDLASRQSLGAAAAASVAASAEGYPAPTPPPEPARADPEGAAAAYQSGFEDPAAGHPGGADDAGWSFGGGWSDSSDTGSTTSDSGGSGDSGSSSSE